METRVSRPYFFVKNTTAADGDTPDPKQWTFIDTSCITMDTPSLPLIRMSTNSAEHPNLSFDRAWFSEVGVAALMKEDDDFANTSSRDTSMSGPDLYYIVDSATDETLAYVCKPRRLENELEIHTTRKAGETQGLTALVGLLGPTNLMERALSLLGITLVGFNVEPKITPYYDYRIPFPF
jgi:hypothetical protein